MKNLSLILTFSLFYQGYSEKCYDVCLNDTEKNYSILALQKKKYENTYFNSVNSRNYKEFEHTLTKANTSFRVKKKGIIFILILKYMSMIILDLYAYYI